MENQMSVKYWVKTLIIVAIPIVNLFFLLKWAFGKDNPRKNYSRAFMIVISCVFGLSLILGILGAITDSSLLSSSNSYNTEIYSQKTIDTLQRDLEILDVNIVNGKVIGRVRNNSKTPHALFLMDFNVYDKDNSIVDNTKVAIIQTVPSGETLKFSSRQEVDINAVSVKLYQIRGADANDALIY